MEIAIVTADDLDAIYIDGVLAQEGCCLPVSALAEVLDGKMFVGTIRTRLLTADQAWIEDEGNFPQHLTDVRLT